MPMAKRKMFKTIDLAKFENLGTAGGWNPLADLLKQQAGMKSAYVDKLRISFILEGDSSGSTDKHLGYMFAVSTRDTMSAVDADNSQYIVGCSASRGGGGVVTIPVNRTIRDNSFDATSGTNALRLHCRMTDTGSESYNVTMIIETWGRWHQVVSA